MKPSDEFGSAAPVRAGLEGVEFGPGVGTLDAYQHTENDLVYVMPREDLAVVLEPLLRRVATRLSAAPSYTKPAPVRERDDVLRVLIVATEWHSRNGGISSFNRGLCKALARAGADVECLVGPEEDASADETYPVHVTPVETVNGSTEETAVIQALAAQPATYLDGVDVVIGHGHITGGAARKLTSTHYSNAIRVHIVHTRSVQVAAGKVSEDSTNVLAAGEGKLEREQTNARTAQLVCGVGPKLLEEAETLVRAAVTRPPVIKLMPGLDMDIPVIDDWPPPRQTIYTVGRVNEAAKGTDVLIRAVSQLKKDGSRRVMLLIRGVPPQDADREQARLQKRIREAYILGYSADTKRLHEDLWRVSIMCMPSTEEGFGLVALEAIAAGIPVLVDSHSGLADVLREIDPHDPAIVEAPAPIASAVKSWREKLAAALDDPESQRNRARKRREDLASHCDWDATARVLLEEIDLLRSG